MRTELFPHITFFCNVDSTNDVARHWLSSKKRNQNAVFVASKQSKGKGRGKREWYSSRGGLYFTMVFHDRILPPSVTLFTGVIIHKILRRLYPDIDLLLKWPNDIMLGNKKVCGILTFTHQNATYIGVGINCNMKNFPDELAHIATSLYIETRQKMKLKKVLSDVITLFSTEIDEFNKLGFMPFKEYFELFHILTGKKVSVQLAHKSTVGEVKAISQNGTLLIYTDKGDKEFFAVDKIDILS